MLGPSRGLLKFRTLLLFVFFHLHGRCAEFKRHYFILHPRSVLLMFQYSRCAFTRTFKSYGAGWCWKLCQSCLVCSISWESTQIKLNDTSLPII